MTQLKRRSFHSVSALILMAALSGCLGQTPDFRPNDSPFAPTVNRRGTAVDGLLVGHRLMAAGENELALDAFTRAASEQGFTPDILSALGTVNLQLGRLGQAETYMRRAITADAAYLEAWNNLGVILLETDRTAEAVQTLRQAYALSNGQSDEIRDNLRLALAKFEKSDYGETQSNYKLVHRGSSDYLIRTTP